MEERPAGRECHRRRVGCALDPKQRMLIQSQLLWRTSSIYIQHSTKEEHPTRRPNPHPRWVVCHLRLDIRYHNPRPFQCANTVYTRGPKPPSAKVATGIEICCAAFSACWHAETQRLVLLWFQRYDSTPTIRPWHFLPRYCTRTWSIGTFSGSTNRSTMEPEVWRYLGGGNGTRW